MQMCLKHPNSSKTNLRKKKESKLVQAEEEACGPNIQSCMIKDATVLEQLELWAKPLFGQEQESLQNNDNVNDMEQYFYKKCMKHSVKILA